ncbi:MAG: sulfite exporter TauE/SafE family protein [Stagnimonas sp.]|nr:sulfite exporter TauE/SafE family protein [Stagnimonas sp.]
MTTLLIFALTGAAAGLLAGLFGVGGGLIMVPALAFVLPALGVPAAVVMQVAIGTSLAVIGATSLSSTRAHHRRGGVRWDLLRGFAPGLALGALGGAFVAHLLSGGVLKNTVGIGALLVAAQMFFGAQPKPRAAGSGLPTAELLAAGGGIGLLSALVGIGGGSLTVPYLSWRGVSMQQAVGTAAAGGIPIAWGGALGFVLSGWRTPGLDGAYLGYVSLLAFLGLAVASVLTAPQGARLAHALPAQTLKRAFALLLASVGLLMLLR